MKWKDVTEKEGHASQENVGWPEHLSQRGENEYEK